MDATTAASIILARLKIVDDERERRRQVPNLHARVVAVKAYQQRRFIHTYADLLRSERYAAASHFFLDELYGPEDFRDRDAQFGRVVPALVRLFPKVIVNTVAQLAELHAVSEQLDSELALQLDEQPLTARSYVLAWQVAGRREDRDRQIALTAQVAESLDGITRNALVRGSLRVMRGPAQAAGLGDIQAFLELGFDTFRAMRGATEFVTTVRTREKALVSALFAAGQLGPAQNESMSTCIELLPPEGA